MSIIHKALKRSEESKAKEKKVRMRVFLDVKGRKRLWGTLLVVLATSALVFFFILYFIKSTEQPKHQTPVALPDVKTEPAIIQSQPPKRDTSQLLEEAIKNFRESKYVVSEKLLKEALLIEPDNPSLHNHLGLALRRQGKLRDAISAYEKAMKLKPDYFEAMNNMAVALEAVGQRKKAEELYKKALSINPSYAEAHLNYGLLLEVRGRLDEAKAHYQSFLVLSKDEELKRLVQRKLR
ncbi:MAG: tetratricopeptide repeat protein [Nitrospirae bacterium]|nr:tetratricopeptide repeat protein [Nitrospirota bacterium]